MNKYVNNNYDNIFNLEELCNNDTMLSEEKREFILDCLDNDREVLKYLNPYQTLLEMKRTKYVVDKIKEKHEPKYDEFFTENAIEKWGINKLFVILDGIDKGFDITIYADSLFNAEQMNVILKGLEHNVDVKKFADAKYCSEQMCMLELGLELGINIELYALPILNSKQMKQILVGLCCGVNILDYCDYKTCAEDMETIRKVLTYKGKSFEKYGGAKALKTYNIKQLKEIFEGISDNLDIEKFDDPNLDWRAMRAIRIKLYKDVIQEVIDDISLKKITDVSI